MRNGILIFTAFATLASAQTGLQRLEANIGRITRSVAADWGIYIKCLETGEEIALNADRQMDTMSVIKIPLMVETFHQIDAGKLKLTDKHTLQEEEKRPGTGILRSLDPGAAITLKDILTLMTIVSDNTATDLAFTKTGGVEPTNQRMAALGLSSIRATNPTSVWFRDLRAAKSPEQFHRDGKTPFGLASPRDMGRLLERIKKGDIPGISKTSSDLMLQILRGQVYSSRLPKYVTGFRVPHKTGDFLPYIGNDVGILESSNRNVVICVFTAHHYGIGPNLEDAIARIAELTANYFYSPAKPTN
jgi:beta-lactamase class A